MILFSHLLLSRIIRAQVRKTNFTLHHRRFSFGNVKPDICKMIVKQRHKINDSYEYVRDAITELSNSPFYGNRNDYSYKLGIVCHYITDFFTYAHNKNFNGSFKEHMNYEMLIHEKILDFNNSLRSKQLDLHKAELHCNVDDVLEYLDRMHKLYMRQVKPSPGRDLTFALLVCTTISCSLLAISSRHRHYAPVVGL